VRPAAAGAVLALLLVTVALAAVPARGDAPFFPTSTSTTLGTPSGTVSLLRAADGVGMTIAEAATGCGLDCTRWHTPVSDASILWASVSSGTGTGPLCSPATAHYCRLDETTVNDGNTSIVASGAGSVEDVYEVSDWTGPADVAFDGVQAWAWVRRNQSADPALATRLFSGLGNPCIQTIGIGGQAFYNLTGPLEANTCPNPPGNPWTVADVNAVQVAIAKINVGGSPLGTATTVGVTVQYDDADYDLATTYTWDAIDDARATELSVVASSSDAETFSIQLRTCGTQAWTTMGTVTGTSLARQRIDATGFVCGPRLDLRFVSDSVTPDNTVQSTLSVDYLALDIVIPGGGDPIIEARVACELQGFTVVRCAASEYTTSPVGTRTWRFSPAVTNLRTFRTGFGWIPSPFPRTVEMSCHGLPFLDPGDCQAVEFDAPPWWTFNLHEIEVRYTLDVFTLSLTVRTVFVVDYRPYGFMLLGIAAMIVGGLVARRLKEPKPGRKPSGPPELDRPEE